MTYYYVEGTMAPMGTFSNYKRIPRALAMLDRSLTETSPGDYATPVHLTAAGSFDVPVLIDQPRIVHCFSAEVPAAVGLARTATGPAILIEPLFAADSVRSGVPAKLAFKILDADSGQPLNAPRDLRALVSKPPGAWQRHPKLDNVGDGIFEFTLVFPSPGHYNIVFARPGQRARPSYMSYSSVIVRETEDISARATGIP